MSGDAASSFCSASLTGKAEISKISVTGSTPVRSANFSRAAHDTQIDGDAYTSKCGVVEATDEGVSALVSQNNCIVGSNPTHGANFT